MNIKKLQSVTISGKNIYYFAFLYYYILSFLRFTTFAPTISANWMIRLSYLAVVLLLIKIYVFDKQTIKSFTINTFIILLSLISWRHAHAVDVLAYTLFILGAKNINFRVIINWFFKLGVIMLILTMIYSQLGIIKDLIYVRNHTLRHAMGIVYPTDLAAHIFYLILAYFYLYFEKITWRSYVGIVFVAGLTYFLTQARLDVLLSLLAIPVIFVAKQAYSGKKVYSNIASFYWIVTPILAYITVIASIFYNANNSLFRFTNEAFSKRLEISHLAIEKYNVTLFGKHVLEHGFGSSQGIKHFYQSGMSGNYFFIDSSFIRLAIIYGLVIGIFVIIVMLLIGMRSISTRGFCLAAIVLLLGISCMIEQHLLDISYNPFLIALLADNAYYYGINKNAEG
ncbi:hypothetical protein CP354_04910 [Lactobacillus sp. UMNPBX3]|nr:hypothetical protein CP354_04910 [Lactobacillus sp. UMNPBX3]